MAPLENHPFKNGIKELPEGKKKDMLKIKAWINTQPHIPEISDEFLYLFLHACYYSQDKTKSAIENYFTIRTTNPNIFGDRDFNSPKMKTMMSLALCDEIVDGKHIVLTVRFSYVKAAHCFVVFFTKLVFSDNSNKYLIN